MSKSEFHNFCINMSLRLEALEFILTCSENNLLIPDSINYSSELQLMIRSLVVAELHNLALDFNNCDVDKYF